jgi:hypothetical protein
MNNVLNFKYIFGYSVQRCSKQDERHNIASQKDPKLRHGSKNTAFALVLFIFEDPKLRHGRKKNSICSSSVYF